MSKGLGVSALAKRMPSFRLTLRKSWQSTSLAHELQPVTQVIARKRAGRHYVTVYIRVESP